MRRTGVETRSVQFAAFYEQNRAACLTTVTACVGDRVLAEDLVAESFARAWAAWRKVASHPAPKAWVVRTALNLSVSWWRQRRHELPWVGQDVAAAQPAFDGVDAVVMAALLRLPDRQREVIALRVFLDLDTEATAQALGIAPGTVTAHMSRALSNLRHQLSPATAVPAGPTITPTKE